MTKTKLINTGKKIFNRLIGIVPIILLVFIIEGTFRRLTTWLMVAYMAWRTVVAVRYLKKTGQIDLLGEQLFGRGRK